MQRAPYSGWLLVDPRGRFAVPPARLTATPDDISSLNASAGGKRIAYTKKSLNPGVYVSELSAGGMRLRTPQRLTLDNWRDYPFSWTPDSKAVLFGSDRVFFNHIFKPQIYPPLPELLVGG